MKSEKFYARLQRFLIALFILEIIAGLASSVISEYIEVLVKTRVFHFDKQEVLSVLFVVKLFGLHVAFFYLCGVSVVLLLNEVYTRHMGIILKLWLLLAIETAIGSIFIVWSFVDSLRYLMEHFEASLLDGINLYQSDPIWMLIWDDLQYDFKCCGVQTHMDWKKVNQEASKKHKTDLSWLPFSCANGKYPSTEILRDENIHTTGCFTAVSGLSDNAATAMITLNVSIVVLLVSKF